MERQQAKQLWDWSVEEEGENQCPRPLPYPAGTQLPKSEENVKWPSPPGSPRPLQASRMKPNTCLRSKLQTPSLPEGSLKRQIWTRKCTTLSSHGSSYSDLPGSKLTHCTNLIQQVGNQRVPHKAGSPNGSTKCKG